MKKNYITPDIDFEPMYIANVICDSGMVEDGNDGGIVDYEPIDDFTW